MFRSLKGHYHQAQIHDIKYKIYIIALSQNSDLSFTKPVHILQHNMVKN